MPELRPNYRQTLTAEQEHLWSNAIGGVFLNFGAIEFASYRWIEALGRDSLMRDMAIDMRLSQRITLIKMLIERTNWSEQKKKKTIELWNEVADRSRMRNTIAHNPFTLGRDRDGESASGILNVKHMKGDGPYEVPLIQVSELLETAHRAGALITELDALWATNDSESAPQRI